MNDKTKNQSFVLAVFLSITLLASPTLSQNSQAQVSVEAPTFLTINSSDLSNANDFLSGIAYDGSQFVYLTAHNNGELIKVNKDTFSYTVLNDGNAGSAGRDWKTLATNSTNATKFYMSEADTGLFHAFWTDGNVFKKIPLPQDVSGGDISYTISRNTAPHKITCTGGNQHVFGFDSRAKPQVTNNFIWQAIDYKYDFSNKAGCGTTDVEFHGVVKINPKTLDVTRHSISGAQNIRGATIDASDSTIIWLTDNTADKIFKFDTSSSSVTQTINIPAGSKARGIACDDANCYVALNKAGNGVDTAKILKVVKATGTTSEIDTGAVVESGKNGTFEVFIAQGVLFFSTESSQVGTYTISNDAKTVSSTSETDANHYGTVVGDKVWWAGKGSAKIVITSFPTSVSVDKNSGNKDYLKNPTFGVSHDSTRRQMVDYGFIWLNILTNIEHRITDNYYTHFPKILVPTAIPNTAILKIFSDYQLYMVEFALVPATGYRHNAESAVTIYFDHYMNVTKIDVRQKDRILDENLLNVLYDKKICNKENKIKKRFTINDQTIEQDVLCHEITIKNILFREKPFFEVVSLMAVDVFGRQTISYLNEGLGVNGLTINPPKTALMASNEKYKGLVEMTQLNKFTNVWSTNEGDLYTRNDYGSWILLFKNEKPVQCNDWNFKVLNRHDCNFNDVKKAEHEKAVLYLDANYPELFIENFAEINDIVLWEESLNAYSDCEGNKVSQKLLDCNIMKIMQEQNRIAENIMIQKGYTTQMME